MQTAGARATSATPRINYQKQNDAVWVGPSLITTFVRCLRLLDLDLRDDWPGVTDEILSTSSVRQNLQARTKCVEWSLYRLFELWDANEAKHKLRPFFPPLTQLQSLNLRAALYRGLTDLKKNGFLGREVVLRKTMLDECKGEKFEEVVAYFALLVLKKTYAASSREVPALTHSVQFDRYGKNRLLPLIIALRKTLQQQITQRHAIRSHADAYNQLLIVYQAGIEQRQAAVRSLTIPTESNDAHGLSGQVSNCWSGDERWASLIIEGPGMPERSLLHYPFETGWTAVQEQRDLAHARQNILVNDLDSRISKHELRLRKWKAFEATLQGKHKRNGVLSSKNMSARQTQCTAFIFDKHQPLQHVSQEALIDTDVGRERLEAAHQSLLQSMVADLAEAQTVGTSRSSGGHWVHVAESTEDIPRPNALIKAQATQSRLPQQSAVHKQTQVSILQERKSPDDYPRSRKAFTRDVMSKPTKTTAVTTRSMPDSNEMNQSDMPAKVMDYYEIQQRQEDNDYTQTHHPSSNQFPFTPDHTYLSVGVTHQPSGSLKLHSAKHVSLSRELQNCGDPERSTKAAKPSSERNDPREPELPTHPVTTNRKQSLEPRNLTPGQLLTEIAEVGTMRPPPSTLLERTRQSMSLLPNPADRSSRKSMASKQARQSQIFPVNQFETPRKTKAKEILQDERSPSESGASTPRDQLFSEEAEYASVFKSRPKIALSPALSPDKSSFGLDSMLEEDLGNLTLANDD